MKLTRGNKCEMVKSISDSEKWVIIENMANELVSNYSWDSLNLLIEKCIEFNFDYYEMGNGFGIEDYTFYYED